MAFVGLQCQYLLDGIQLIEMYGNMYHLIGSLLPDPGTFQVFAQIYIYDFGNPDSSADKLAIRLNVSTDTLDKILLFEL